MDFTFAMNKIVKKKEKNILSIFWLCDFPIPQKKSLIFLK